MSNPSYILTSDSFVLYYEGQVHTTNSSHPRWEEICQLLKERNWDAIIEALTPLKRVQLFIEGTEVMLDEGHLYFKGELLHGALVQRIIDMQEEGFDIRPMVLFLVNLQENPSYSSRQQLYTFLSANNLPITEDGYFIAFKRIRGDYYDVHSGKYYNYPGCTVEMDRHRVDDNPNNTCSAGLHVCSREYLANYTGERVVSCKVNPRDVVSVPTDYDFTKMRVCHYEVIEELPLTILHTDNPRFTPSVYQDPEQCDEEDYEEDYEEESEEDNCTDPDEALTLALVNMQ